MQDVTVSVSISDLSADQYSDTITFTITTSTGSNPAQVSIALTVQRQISSTQTQSQTVQATRSGQTKATNATGTLTFTNYDLVAHIYSKDTTYVISKSGVKVAIDEDANVPRCCDQYNPDNSVSVSAHAVNSGAAGNIAPGDVDTCVSPPDPDGCTVTVKNDAAFTGGQDAQIYTFVQQSDIDGASTSLKNSTQQSAIDDIHQQLQPNEHLVGDPQCSSNVSSDHKAGDRVSQVTVTVTTTCKATAST